MKQIMQVDRRWLKLGGRQTSWLFSSINEKLNQGPPRKNHSRVVRGRLETGTVWCLLTTNPRLPRIYKLHKITEEVPEIASVDDILHFGKFE